jgi:hypothetical protein
MPRFKSPDKYRTRALLTKRQGGKRARGVLVRHGWDNYIAAARRGGEETASCPARYTCAARELAGFTAEDRPPKL